MWTKEVVRSFVLEFEKHPCLYAVTSVDYKNKIKRLNALRTIVQNLSELGITVTIDDVKKKIHGLRSQYSNELKKIKTSKSSGAGEDDVYTPTLWCFDLLHFLNDNSFPQRTGESNIEMVEDEVLDETVVFEGTLEEFQNSEMSQTMVPSPATSVRSGSIESTSRRGKRKHPGSDLSNDTLGGLIVDASKMLATVANKNVSSNMELPEAFCISMAQELGVIKNKRILQKTKRNIMNLIFDAQEEDQEIQY